MGLTRRSLDLVIHVLLSTAMIRKPVNFRLALAGMWLVAAGSLGTLKADIVSTETGGTQSTPGSFYWGVIVPTVAGKSWNNLVFNFFTSAGNPQASGSLYLLSQQYLGKPSALSPATPGYIATATDTGDFYTFAPDVTATGNTTYWAYTNATLQLLGNDPGGHYYASTGANNNFVSVPTNGVNYALTGTHVSPEPGSILLFGTVLGLAGLILRRKFAVKESSLMK